MMVVEDQGGIPAGGEFGGVYIAFGHFKFKNPNRENNGPPLPLLSQMGKAI